jgi:hypothetical protein
MVDEEAAVDKPADEVGDLCPGGVRRDRRGRTQVEAADEDGQPLEHLPLRLVEEVVAPLDDLTQRTMARVDRSTAAEQSQLVVQGGE